MYKLDANLSILDSVLAVNLVLSALHFGKSLKFYFFPGLWSEI